MSRLALLILTTTLSLALAGCDDKPSTYRNDGLGFSVTLRSGWVVYNDTAMPDPVRPDWTHGFDAELFDQAHVSLAHLLISALPLPDVVPEDPYELLAHAFQMESELALQESDRHDPSATTLGGFPAVSWYSESIHEGELLAFGNYFAITNDHIYRFSFAFSPSMFDELLPIIQTTADSFRVD